MTVELQPHIFLHISRDISHTYKKKIHSCFLPCCQKVFGGSCPTTASAAEVGLQPSWGKHLHWDSTAFKGGYHHLAGAVQTPPDIATLFQSRGGDIPFSILVLNLLLGARAHTLRDSLDNGFFSADFDYSSSFIAQPILRTVWQNNTRPSHYLSFFLISFLMFLQSPTPTYFLFLLSVKNYKILNAFHLTQIGTLKHDPQSLKQIMELIFGLAGYTTKFISPSIVSKLHLFSSFYGLRTHNHIYTGILTSTIFVKPVSKVGTILYLF